MIIEYHRPKKIDDALALLARSTPKTLPLAGGTVINQPSPDQIAVVDLQALGLDKFSMRGSVLEAGAAVTLQALLDFQVVPTALKEAIQHEAAINIRQMATLGGTVAAADGRSALLTALLALDVQIELRGLSSGTQSISIGDLLSMRAEQLHGRLITRMQIPLNIKLAYASAARTPADLPIVCAAVCQWPSGRTRLALGGYGAVPYLAMDGPEPSGIEQAAANAYIQAEDQWASAAYRQETAVTLGRRCLQAVAS